ncbi:MAG: hypothetical protein M3Y58_16460, partial [Chloroflexota bacterium]|nr:hypothetical protein [Chloroflexota bacterium]
MTTMRVSYTGAPTLLHRVSSIIGAHHIVSRRGHRYYSGMRAYLFRDRGNRYADRMIDLHTASRDDLIRMIITQHERITALEAV